MRKPPVSRRQFLLATAAGVGTLVIADPVLALRREIPTDDPASHLRLSWTGKLRWSTVLRFCIIPCRPHGITCLSEWDRRPTAQAAPRPAEMGRSRAVCCWGATDAPARLGGEWMAQPANGNGSPDAMIEVENLSRYYGPVAALTDVSFRASRGESSSTTRRART